jgi:hypothetical protein
MDLSEFAVVPGPTEDRLAQRQLVDYRNEREDCLEWLLAFGKDPEKAEGYATTTVESRIYRMDHFYRFVWDREDHYTTNVTHEHADAWMKQLAYEEWSDAHRDCCQKAVMMLFKWRAHERGGEEWEPSIRFNSGSKTTAPRDFLTRDERSAIREASLEYGSIPSYNNVSPKERGRIKAYLAQRFEKPPEVLKKGCLRDTECVHLRDVKITGDVFVGDLVGFNDGTVCGSDAKGSVSGTNVGDLVGGGNPAQATG